MVRLFSSRNNSGRSKDASHVIVDDEFGEIIIKHTSGNYLRLKVRTDGRLEASMPRLARRADLLNLIDKSRSSLRQALRKAVTKPTYQDGDKVGKSHKLVIRPGVRLDERVQNATITITVPTDTPEAILNQTIKDGVARALRVEAKAYLPRRLRFLAIQHSFSYERVRFTHAKTRWSSCSSTGTISLNIMLMTLPDELIDYVLLHELNHTRHMDHSAAFWADLEKICPHAKRRRLLLRNYSPYL